MLTIGFVAKRTGLAVSAIRYYEDEGLISVGRSAAGHRRFARADIRRLSFIKITQGLGFSIAEIRAQLATLPDNRTPTQGDWARLSQGFRQHLDARIDGLTRLRDKLDGCIGCGCLSLTHCKLYNPDDVAGQSGSGALFITQDPV